MRCIYSSRSVSIPPGLTSPLATAIVKARLPFVRSLHLTPSLKQKNIGYLWQPQNIAYIVTAIERGYLSRLTELEVMAGEAVSRFYQAFRKRFLNGEKTRAITGHPSFQADLRMLIVKQEDNFGYSWGPLQELLSLTAFGHLKCLHILCSTKDDITIKNQLKILATYLQLTQGAPYLKSLSIHVGPGHQNRCSMGPLLELLMNDAAPNLDELLLGHFDMYAFQELGSLYRAGRFANLKTLGLLSPGLDAVNVRL